MQDYFNSVSQGIVDTQLLVKTVGANFKDILPEAFRKELLRTVDLRVRTKTWLSDPKALQARLDLALLQLMDEGKVGKMLENIRKSADFYEEVMIDLIVKEIPDVTKECDLFNAKFKDVVKSAVSAALSEKEGRAKKFIDEINSQCLNMFKDNHLAMNLIKDSDGYEGCDYEEEQVFKEQCLQLVEGPLALKTWPILWDGNWKTKLSKEVLEYMQTVRSEEVARPRCKVACPLCRSLCIHDADHDTLTRKHDTHHQPGGLTGTYWDLETQRVDYRGTLCQQTCANNLMENNRFKFNDEWRSYQDFGKVYTDWMDPKLLERLPLREYIFANYQEDIAKKYDRKECIDIPADYHHDLETIRADREREANLSQDN